MGSCVVGAGFLMHENVCEAKICFVLYIALKSKMLLKTKAPVSCYDINDI